MDNSITSPINQWRMQLSHRLFESVARAQDGFRVRDDALQHPRRGGGGGGGATPPAPSRGGRPGG
eukprot:6934256-Pyramimonas_sp.AAC.1